MNVHASGTSGYSLLELLVVLAIMSLVMLAALPSGGGALGRLTLSGDARAISTDLRRLREMAADRQSDITITPQPSNPAELAVSTGETLSLPSGTRVEVKPGPTGRRAFILGWDGTASGMLVLTRNGATARITADRLTGRLVLEGTR